MVQMFMRNLKNVSALWSVRFRVPALEKFCCKGFLRNSSRTIFFSVSREVSALEDVRSREVTMRNSESMLIVTQKPNNSNSIVTLPSSLQLYRNIYEVIRVSYRIFLYKVLRNTSYIQSIFIKMIFS